MIQNSSLTIIAIAASAFVLGAGVAEPATFNVVFGGICGDLHGVSSGNASCSDRKTENGHQIDINLETRGEAGSIGLRGNVTALGLPGLQGSMGESARFSVNFFDTLTFGIDSGSFLLPVDLFGTFSTPPPPGHFTGGGGTADAVVNFNVTANGTNALVYSQASVGTTGAPSARLADGRGSLGTTVLSLAIENGQIDLVASLAAFIRCQGRFEDGLSCTSAVDFFNSARFLAATVLDASGNEVFNPTISAASGFDYLTGLQPHSATVVPLPASFLLLAAAIASFGLMPRHRSS